MNENQFVEFLRAKNLEVSDSQLALFKRYYDILVDYNQKVNLTSLTDLSEVYLKHFYDSLTILTEYQLAPGATLCDVGAGAGFPSVPLKILRPDLDITIIDSLGKRIEFLNYLFEQLGLTKIKAIHARAEEFATTHRETFQIVTARAVARLNLLAELCIPLVKLGGEFIALKGSTALEEANEAKTGIDLLGCQPLKMLSFDLPFNGGSRSILVYKKIKSTPPKYPRNFGQMKKKPL